MSTFDKIIGYDTIKDEMRQVCDMIHNKAVYENLGAKLPKGLLLFGDPGLGKTLMAKCFIEDAGLKTYTIRRNKGNDDFIAAITDTFNTAKKNAPSIVFLDDMDKFANEDERHRDAEEYVAVQAGIDEVKNSDVFVIATANEMWKLPDSLTRTGRFDRKIEVQSPTAQDAERIIAHYLKDKKTSENLNIKDLSMMISHSSCAELETIINEAAVLSAYARKDKIDMEDIIQAVLRLQYNAPDNYTKTDAGKKKKVALHEAGHLVVSEAIREGSVGLISIRSSGRSSVGGFTHRCAEFENEIYNVLVSLAGKAAVELYYSDIYTEGCSNDISRAFYILYTLISENGMAGMNMHEAGSDSYHSKMSEGLHVRNEAVIHAEIERYYKMAKDILQKNRQFLEKVTEVLAEKETLVHSDIQKIRQTVTVSPVCI